MARVIQPVDYVTKDYEGFKQLMIDSIPALCPEWTDLSDHDQGIVLLKLLSQGLDVLAYYQDKAVNENLLPTAKTRKAVITLCRSLGYELSGQEPSQIKIIVKKQAQFLNEPLELLAGTVVSTNPDLGKPILFEVDKTLTIPAGATGIEKDINGDYIYYTTVTHGVTKTDLLGKGTGGAGLEIFFNNESILLDTVSLWTTEYNVIRTWTRVEDFLSSTASDRHYVLVNDEMGRTYAKFGDGVNGFKPPSEAPINSSYRVGGGIVGNVPIGSINRLYKSENVLIEYLTNPENPIVYGRNAESTERAKMLAPKLFRANDRAVTSEDFEALASKYSGVLKAKCVEPFSQYDDIDLYIAVNGYTAPTTALKAELKAYLEKKSISGTIVNVKDGLFRTFDITVNATVYSTYSNEAVKALIEKKLQATLSTDNFEFGEKLNKSVVNSAIKSINGVDDIDIVIPNASSIVPASNELLKLGTLTVNVTGGVS
jgi:hypothetical protein